MQDNINKALKYLSNLEYSSYFEIMDKLVPSHLWATHQMNRRKYISGHTSWEFNQQLEIFTKEVGRVINENTNAPPSNQHINPILDRINAIKSTLLKDQIKKALKALAPLSEEICDNRFSHQVIIMTGSFNRNESDKMLNTPAFYLSQRRRISSSILSILEEMKEEIENPF